MKPVRIDIHPHFFNGHDLPVAGFITATRGKRWRRTLTFVGNLLGKLATTAPSIDDDRKALGLPIADDRRRVNVAAPMLLVMVLRLVLLRYVMVAVLYAFRYSRMFLHARRSRLWMVKRLDGYTRTSDYPIDLYVPLSVDMEHGSNQQQAPATPLQQFDLLAEISEASLRGRLGIDGIVLPMIGYDPYREPDDPRNNLAEVKARVWSGKAIGIKLYPPMGFLPWGNADVDVEGRLHDLYAWCELHGVPITAHCSPANSVKGAECNAWPSNWEPVLEQYSALHLNLAHVGGLKDEGWTVATIEFVASQLALGRHVFADVSNHDLRYKAQRKRFFEQLFEQVEIAASEHSLGRDQLFSQLMYGSDYWFMTANTRPGRFLVEYVEAAAEAIPVGDSKADLIASFLGCAARRFLMLDDEHSANHRRVIERLQRLDEPPGTLLLTQSTMNVLGLDGPAVPR